MANATTTTKQTPWIVLDRSAGVAGVTSVNGDSGVVVLDESDLIAMKGVTSVNGNLPDPTTGNVNIQNQNDVSVLYLGEIMHVSTDSVPAGSLPADGTQYLRSNYPDLITAMSTGGTITTISDSAWRDGSFDSFSWGTLDGTDTGEDGTETTGDYFRVPDVTKRIQNLDLRKLIDEDLNLLTADYSGWWYQNIAADAQVALNYPVEGICGTLVVYGNGTGPANGQAQGAYQSYYCANSNDIYNRFYTAATDLSLLQEGEDPTGGVWSDWVLEGSEFGSMHLSGNITVDGTMHSDGDASVGGDFGVTGALNVTGNIKSASGDISAYGNVNWGASLRTPSIGDSHTANDYLHIPTQLDTGTYAHCTDGGPYAYAFHMKRNGGGVLYDTNIVIPSNIQEQIAVVSEYASSVTTGASCVKYLPGLVKLGQDGWAGTDFKPNNTFGDHAGIYAQGSNANALAADGYPNCGTVASPAYFAGVLHVLQNNATNSNGCTQIYYPYNSTNFYVRTYNASNSTWIGWVRFTGDAITATEALELIKPEMEALKVEIHEEFVEHYANTIEVMEARIASLESRLALMEGTIV